LRELELECARRRGCYFNKEVLIYSYESKVFGEFRKADTFDSD
jgi:hypothetical protein